MGKPVDRYSNNSFRLDRHSSRIQRCVCFLCRVSFRLVLIGIRINIYEKSLENLDLGDVGILILILMWYNALKEKEEVRLDSREIFLLRVLLGCVCKNVSYRHAIIRRVYLKNTQ